MQGLTGCWVRPLALPGAELLRVEGPAPNREVPVHGAAQPCFAIFYGGFYLRFGERPSVDIPFRAEGTGLQHWDGQGYVPFILRGADVSATDGAVIRIGDGVCIPFRPNQKTNHPRGDVLPVDPAAPDSHSREILPPMDNVHQGFAVLQQGIKETGGVGAGALRHRL